MTGEEAYWAGLGPGDDDCGDPDDLECIHCCGDGFVENDDPIQRGPEKYIKCFSCGGSGKRKDMTVW